MTDIATVKELSMLWGFVIGFVLGILAAAILQANGVLVLPRPVEDDDESNEE